VSDDQIRFNRPHMTGKELYYIAEAKFGNMLAGDGPFTKRCHQWLEQHSACCKALLTHSCTAALEMSALLLDIQPGDEVIMPSYTFVSTANAVVRLGARPVFVDIRPDTLNLDETLIEEAITPRTKAIFPVHYAGVGCEMDRIMDLARAYKLWVVEDAAQGVNAFYQGRALGSIGHLGCYSFHETKNVICGEGGALCINDPNLIERAEIIRDKGTNRKQFFRGLVDKYTWVDVGSSYVPSEICCAFLYAQLERIDDITLARRAVYESYNMAMTILETDGLVRTPRVPQECESNWHIFYLLTATPYERDHLLDLLRTHGIHAVFHYVPLHTSPKGQAYHHDTCRLPITEDLACRLLRLPIYYGLSESEQAAIIAVIRRSLIPTATHDVRRLSETEAVLA